MSELAPILTTLRESVASTAPTGVIETGVPGVIFFWLDHPTPRSPLLYDTGLVIIGQGHKVGYLGGRQYRYDADTCLVLGVPVPFECESHGTPEEPLLGIRINIDVTALHGLVARFAGQLGLGNGPQPNHSPIHSSALPSSSIRSSSIHSGVEPLKMQGALLDATRRLLTSVRDPLDRQVVGPAAVEEILYRVLRSEHGRVLHALTQHHTPYASVAGALTRIHGDYRRSLSVDDLASESGMSVSSFHRAFKEVTGETPLQYLKKIRLLKAKALLVFEGKRVDEAAYTVGYASPSQFSREFKRYFQVPPSQAETLPYNDDLQPLA